MTLDDFRKIGVSATLDLEDLRLLREVLLSFDDEDRNWQPMKRTAFAAMGAAFHAAVVACENAPR